MSKLFTGSNISSFYRSARPRYPNSVMNLIFRAWKQLSSVKMNSRSFEDLKRSGLALDIGCGSGQLTELLGNHFAKVIASDISATQVSTAQEAFSDCNNLEFHVGDCYNLKCPNQGADLITVAQALHWFDVPKFHTEASRCLKPTGALALLTYGFCSIRCHSNESYSETRINQLMQEYFQGDKYIGPYWDSRRELVNSSYKTLPMFNEKQCIRMTEEMPLDLTMSQFTDYLKSQSAYHTYLETVKPTSQQADVLNIFLNELEPLLPGKFSTPKEDSVSSTVAEPLLTLVFPLTVIVSVP